MLFEDLSRLDIHFSEGRPAAEPGAFIQDAVPDEEALRESGYVVGICFYDLIAEYGNACVLRRAGGV